MATLATITNRLIDATGIAEAPRTQCNVRPLPNEDVFLFVKRIDNSRVEREADPASAGACWRMLILACVAVALLTGLLLPSAHGLLSGYQIQSLRQERTRLLTEQASLDLEIAKLLSPERLERLARLQQFADPAPDSVVHLNPTADASMAASLAVR